jgi:peptidyl-prolyl cis-trans isomerase SurA
MIPVPADRLPMPPRAPRSSLVRGSGGRLVLLLLLFAADKVAAVSDRIVAVVNTEVITLSELRTEAEAEQAALKKKYTGDELARRVKQAEYETLTRMIERKLQMQQARDKKVEVGEDEIKNAIKEMQKQGDKIDESDPKTMKKVHEQMTLMRVVDREVRGGVMVSEADLQKYYLQHQRRFLLPEEFRLSQILLVPRSKGDRAEVREKARMLHEELKKGRDFADLAVQFSDGPEATKGGSLGFVRQGELLPQIEQAILPLQAGETTPPIDTAIGIHIIRVEERTPPQYRPFAEVRNEIQGLVYREKTEDQFQSWIAGLKKKAYIEIKF